MKFNLLFIFVALIPLAANASNEAFVGVSARVIEARLNAYGVILSCEYDGRVDRCDEAWSAVEECERDGVVPEDCELTPRINPYSTTP